MPANAAFLKDIPLFQTMDDAERAAIAALMDEAQFKAGQQLFHERDQGGICYILRSGRVELSVQDENQQKLVVDVLEPGELCGELSLLDGGTRSTSAVALTDVETLVLERPEMVAFLRRTPDASLDVIQVLVKRIRRADALLKQRVQDPNEIIAERVTLGDRLADLVASFGGSWRFIIFFTVAMAVWMGINMIGRAHFDPYPFILLNLCLSTLAALQAPVIMMSQNRQDAKDRIRSEADYRVNVKAEVEIAELHEKLDRMRGELNLSLGTITRKIGGVALVVLLLVGGRAHAEKKPGPIELAVDVSEAPRRIFHTRERIPVQPGAVTLVYPKWIPGEHAPSGPIVELAGLEVRAGGKLLPWKRDPVDMYAIHVDAPSSPLEVRFDYLGHPDAEGFSASSSSTSQLGVLEWNLVVLYPAGPARDVRVKPSLTLPAGWKWGSALEPESNGNPAAFREVSLETLVDSPVLFGAHLTSLPLDHPRAGEPPHVIDIAAEAPADLEVKPETLAMWKQLVAETGALFGARHYARYHFLLALSDHVAHFGLEHHQSSDNRSFERMLVDEDSGKLAGALLPHEFTHSWNGKYRRPIGLATPDFQQPMKGDLLWVYEGLTDYLGFVLEARSGMSADWMHDNFASVAATMAARSGRSWRSIGDTAVAAQTLYGSGPDWTNWRRSVDYYPEGILLWLEVDTILRQKTGGKASLDDFCHRFHGGKTGPAEVVTYTRDDVVKTLNEIAPYDWNAFFARRVESVDPRPPLDGVANAGWKLVFDDKPNLVLKAFEKARKQIVLTFSIGLQAKDDGTILDVVPGQAAALAGLGPGMKIIGVNGRKFKPDVLEDAVRGSKHTPIEVTVENADFLRTVKLKYGGGVRHPHLVRDAGRPDLLADILRAHSVK
jgi:predicted metalloprotease with PDZ domain/uncharacterized membrane protein